MEPSLVRFLQRPAMIIVGTADGNGRPAIARGISVWTQPDTERVTVIVSRWQWPDTVANVGRSERAAVTFSRPSTYETYQIKGPAQVREMTDRDGDVMQTYGREIATTLIELGIEPPSIAHWYCTEDPLAIDLTAEAIFLQTPGPGAGGRIGGAA